MSEKRVVCFDSDLLRHIADGRNDLAKPMINRDLINAHDGFGTLLHYAAKVGNTEITQFLLGLGSDIDSLGQANKTPLVIAVDYKRVALVKVLLQLGANIDTVGANGKSALQMAFHSAYFDTRIIQAFIHKIKDDLVPTEELTDRLYTAGCTLNHALNLKDIEILKGLLRRGFDVNCSNQHDGKTALHVAAELNDFQMVNLLVDYRANVNALDKKDNGPLYYAARNRNLDVIRILLEEGANPNTKIRFLNCTPLFALYVSEKTVDVKQHDGCVKILLQHGAIPQNMAGTRDTIIDLALEISRGSTWQSMKGMNYIIARLAILELTGVPSTELVVRYNDAHDTRVIEKLERDFKLCQQILKFMVFGTTSLLDLLTESDGKLRLRVRNETFIPQVENFCSERGLKKLCEFYYDTLMWRVSKADRRVKLEDEAVTVICDIFQKNRNECYIAARQIFEYLSERDLNNLCQLLL